MVILSPYSYVFPELMPITIERVIEQSTVIHIVCCFELDIYFISYSLIGLPISMQITTIALALS